jgi:phosphate transport system substrate-binding protein
MHPNVNIIIQGGGSSTGVKSAAEGTVDIGAASRELKAEEIGTVVEHVLARDGIAIVTHPSQTVSNLTKEQVMLIFSGQITNWSEIGGTDDTINVVAREEGSGTRAAFEEMVMGEEVITAMAILQPSNGAVRTTVAGDPNAIGFLSFGYLDSTTKALSIDGVAATVSNAISGTYPIVRPLLFLTKGEPTGIVKEFIDFCLGYQGQSIAEEEGYIPVGPTVEMKGEITEAGSTTVQPVAESLAAAFMAKYPDITVIIQGGGSSTGVKSAAEGTVDIGAASRELKAEEIGTVVEHVLARDGIAIVAHPSQIVSNLTKEQVLQIFSGEITNWSEVGGADETINVVAREEGSGTRAAFEEMVMGDALITAMAILQPSNGAVRTTVAGDPNAIGFLSFGYLDSTTKALSIDGVAATVENAINGSYPIVRPLLFLTKGIPEGIVKEFINFCLGPEGQAIVAEDYIPVN